MDVRAFVFGTLAALAIIGAVVLAGLERDGATIASLIGLAGTFAGYVVGLYSSAYTAEQPPAPITNAVLLDSDGVA